MLTRIASPDGRQVSSVALSPTCGKETPRDKQLHVSCNFKFSSPKEYRLDP